MTNSAAENALVPLGNAWARLHLQARALALRVAAPRRHREPQLLDLLSGGRIGRLRPYFIGLGLVAAVVGIACGALWWRLGSGPLALDLATPWLSSALQERL